MALISCYECDGQVSTLAKACPHCGAPPREGEARDPAEAEASIEAQTGDTAEATPESRGEPAADEGVSTDDERATAAVEPPSAGPCPTCGHDPGANDQPPSKIRAPVSTQLIRGYFLLGGLVALPIYSSQGHDALLIYLAQFLLLGFGLSLLGFGIARRPRDTVARGAIIGGAMYSLMVASAIVSANLSAWF